jgi:hypothetical protein
MEQQPQVIVRNAFRHDICLRAQISVIAEADGAIRLAAPSGAKDGWVDADVIDIGSGGVGLISMVFLPRRALLNLRVFAPGEGTSVVFVAPCRVQRVTMTDRRPAYLIGCSFEGLTQENQKQLDALLAGLAGSDAS